MHASKAETWKITLKHMPLQNPFYLKYLPAKIQRQLEGRHNLFAVLHNSGWLVVDKIFKATATIVVGAWVARYLGPNEYGKLAYVLAIVAFFQVVSTLGLDGIVVRDIAKNKDEAGVILGTTFMMRLIVGTVCWLGLVIFMVLMYGWGNENMWLAIFIGGSLIFQAADTIDLWFQSQTKSRRTVLAKLLAILISSSLRITFIIIKAPLIYFAVIFLIEYSIAALALYFAYQRLSCEQSWVVQFKERGNALLKESWPFIISSVSVMVYLRIDQVIIRNILGEKELGIYSAVILFSTGWYFISTTVNSSLLPIMTKLRETNEKIFLEQLVKIFRLLIGFGVLISALTIWQSRNIIRLVYGSEYTEGAGVLAVHILTIIPIFISAGQNLWIYIEKKSKLFLQQSVVGCVISLILNMLLIKHIGIIGAAISSVISQCCALLIINYFLERRLFNLQFGLFFNK